MDLYKVLLSKEVVNGLCGGVSDPQQTRERVCSSSQVRKLTDIVQSVSFASFERIVLQGEGG